MTKEQLLAQREAAARAIDYKSRDWHHVEQWLRAQRWIVALANLEATSDAQACHNKGRVQSIDELLRLSEQFKASSSD